MGCGTWGLHGSPSIPIFVGAGLGLAVLRFQETPLSVSRSLCVFGNGSALESGSPENNEDTVGYNIARACKSPKVGRSCLAALRLDNGCRCSQVSWFRPVGLQSSMSGLSCRHKECSHSLSLT